jgi:mRNA interferase RelE/StbE
MRFELQIAKSFNKDLSDLPEEVAQRVVKEVALLLENSFRQGVIKLTDRESYRTRVGDYRIVFDVNEEEKTVTLMAIGHRSKIYKR